MQDLSADIDDGVTEEVSHVAGNPAGADRDAAPVAAPAMPARPRLTDAWPKLALDMNSEAVTLFAREDGRWKEVASVPLDSADLARDLDELRVTALVHGGKGAPVLLWLPPEQILVRRAKLTETQPHRRETEARSRLEGDTVYAPDELAVAVSPPDADGWSTILATLLTTRAEAVSYATKWGLAPGPVSTRSEDDAFPDGPAVFAPPPSKAVRAARIGRRLGIAAGGAGALAAAVWAGITFIPPLLVAEPERVFTAAPDAPVMQVLAIPPAYAEPMETRPATDRAPDSLKASDTTGARRETALAGVHPAIRLPVYRPEDVSGRTIDGVALQIGGAPQGMLLQVVPAGLVAPAGLGVAPTAAPLPAEPAPVAKAPASVEPDPAAPAAEAEPAPDAEPEAAPEAAPETELASDLAPEETPVPLVRPESIAALAEPEPEPAAAPETDPAADPTTDPATETAAADPETPGAEALPVPVPVPAPHKDPASTVALGDPATPDPAAAAAPVAAPGSTVPPTAAAPVAAPGGIVALPGTASLAPATVAPVTDPDAATRFAALIAPKPPGRPESIAAAVAIVTAPTPEGDLSIPAPPRDPNRGAVRTGTRQVALDLNAASLVGIINSDTGRRALVRLPGGEFKRLSRGDQIDGWKVSMIGVDAMQLSRGGQNVTLLLITR